MNTKQIWALSLMIGAFLMAGDTSIAEEACEQRLEAAKALTHYGTYMAQMLEFGQSGGGTQQEGDAIKERWLEGKRQGIKDLEQIIVDCERQAKAAEDPADAARLLAVAFEAKVAWDTATPGSRKRDIYSDAVAAISAIDHHEETDAVVPFLVGAAMYAWDENNFEEGVDLMERAIDLTGRLHGKESAQRAEQLANLAYLLSPATTPGRKNPRADLKRAEALYSEALAIYDRHPKARATDIYSALVGQAKHFYQIIDNEQRANELAELYSALRTSGQRSRSQ